MKDKIKAIKNGFLGVLVIAIVAVIPTTEVYAGDINDQEQQVLEALKGPFEYEGTNYVPIPEYLEMARQYFAADDMNLTESQKNEAIALIRSNVEMAVLNGYIIPLETEEPIAKEETKDSQVGQNSKDTTSADINSSKEEIIKENKESNDNTTEDSNINANDNEVGSNIDVTNDKEASDNEETKDKQISYNQEESDQGNAMEDTESMQQSDNHYKVDSNENEMEKLKQLIGNETDSIIDQSNFMTGEVVKDTGYSNPGLTIFFIISLLASAVAFSVTFIYKKNALTDEP